MKTSVKLKVHFIIGAALTMVSVAATVYFGYDLKMLDGWPDTRLELFFFFFAAAVPGVLFLYLVLLLRQYRRVLARPLNEAAEFADRLVEGEPVEALTFGRNSNEEIRALGASLNLLRDRQLTLQHKLEWALAREGEVRREIERYDSLQLRILNRMLPDLHPMYGIIKGLTLLIQGALDRKETPEPEDFQEILRQVGRLSRYTDRMVDISQFNRERWNNQVIEDFEAAAFNREVIERNLPLLEAREISLVNHFSASAPHSIRMDRRLLMQLVTLLVRVVGRCVARGESIVFTCFKERHVVIWEFKDLRRLPPQEAVVESFHHYIANLDPAQPYPEGGSLGVLALCFARDLAALLGGSLQVLSTPQSHMVLRFEIDEIDCVAIGRSIERSLRSTRQMGAPLLDERRMAAERGSEAIRVLLYDENLAEIRVIPRVLALENIDADTVESVEALRNLSEFNYDAALMIRSNREEELADLIEELRRAAGRRDLPVIVATNRVSEELYRRLRELDRVWQMTQPLNFTLLAKQLHRAALPAGKR